MIQIIAIALILSPQITRAQDEIRHDIRLLNRIFDYHNLVDTTLIINTDIYAYRKLKINVAKRNATLLPVPTMYRIAYSKERDYIEESIDLLHHNSTYDFSVKRIIQLSTIPKQKEALTRLQKFLIPKFYDETVFGNSILSPFHRNNKHYYKYHFKILHDSLVEISFRPKILNTQLISGRAIVNSVSGRISHGQIRGEFDMINFSLNFVMSDSLQASIFPKNCQLSAKIKFMGNVINTQNTAIYSISYPKAILIPSINKWDVMSKLRCDSLTTQEDSIYKRHFAAQVIDTIHPNKEKSWFKKIFWDVLGDNLLNKINSSYGSSDQGQIRINPLFNPLYMGYNGHKGYYYKFDVRNIYNFNSNNYLYTRLKAGYSFKLRQLYFTLPIEYHFNRYHNGFVKLQWSHGDWIGNDQLKEKMIASLPENTTYNAERVSYFRNFNLSLEGSYDLSQYLTIQMGMIGYKRTAIERHTYQLANVPNSYTSVASKGEIIWRPTGWKGPAVNIAYERSIRGLMDADIAYERFEFDIQHILAFNKLKSLSLRAGGGFYTFINGINNFLDYSNFRDNNIPDGWNDEWTGEFVLLPSHWYNQSRYYIRTNTTYETPLLALSHLPLVGRYIEKERIYANVLFVTKLHPYTEVGYGFTTRWVSVGAFIAQRNGKYDGIGVKIDLELFRQW